MVFLPTIGENVRGLPLYYGIHGPFARRPPPSKAVLEHWPRPPSALPAGLPLQLHLPPLPPLAPVLPPPGFSAGIGQEPHYLRKNWGQILLLAWPGVLISFLIIALCGR
jgi:hypothetical protein